MDGQPVSDCLWNFALTGFQDTRHSGTGETQKENGLAWQQPHFDPSPRFEERDGRFARSWASRDKQMAPLVKNPLMLCGDPNGHVKLSSRPPCSSEPPPAQWDGEQPLEYRSDLFQQLSQQLGVGG